MEKKGDLVWDSFIPWVIGLMLLAALFVIIGVLTGKLGGIGEFLRNLFRFGR